MGRHEPPFSAWLQNRQPAGKISVHMAGFRELLRRLLREEVAAFGLPQPPARTRSGRQQSFGEDSNEFALAMYVQLRQRPGNLFFSPLSIRTALAMTQAGAIGETALCISS